MPLHVSSTCAHHQEVKIALHSLWYHTYRRDDTRGCVIQYWPRDDEHMCSKHVEAWNKLIVKHTFFTSSWLITEINVLECKWRRLTKRLCTEVKNGSVFLSVRSSCLVPRHRISCVTCLSACLCNGKLDATIRSAHYCRPQKQLENMEHCSYLVSVVTNDARYTLEITWEDWEWRK